MAVTSVFSSLYNSTRGKATVADPGQMQLTDYQKKHRRKNFGGAALYFGNEPNRVSQVVLR
jgi:hypothetical protein